MNEENQKPLDHVCTPLQPEAHEKIANMPHNVRGIAHLLQMYCGQKVNHGRIKGARKWTRDHWLMYAKCRLTNKELKELLHKDIDGAWHWEGDDLVVDYYFAEYEEKALAKRKSMANARTSKAGRMNANYEKNRTNSGNYTSVSEPVSEHKIKNKVEEEEKGEGREVRGKLPCVSGSGVVGGGEVSELTHPCSSVSFSPSCGSRDGTLSLSSPVTNSSPPFGEWVATLCGAVPAFADYAKLPKGVEAAARKTYEEMPNAIQYAELLRVYYADKRGMNEKGKEFWRPTGALFFAKLGDVVHNHAEKWAKETGWGKEKKAKQKPATKPEEEDVATPEEVANFREGLAELFSKPQPLQETAEAMNGRNNKNQDAIAALQAGANEGGALKAAVDDTKEEEGQRRVSTGKTPWDAEGAKVQAALGKADGVDGEQGSEEEEGGMTVVQYVDALRRVAPKLCGKLSVDDFMQRSEGRLNEMSREQPKLYASFPILIEYVDENQLTLTQEWVGERFIDDMPALIGAAIEWKKRRVA